MALLLASQFHRTEATGSPNRPLFRSVSGVRHARRPLSLTDSTPPTASSTRKLEANRGRPRGCVRQLSSWPTGPAFDSEQPELPFMRNGEHADDYPRVRRNKVELLSGAEEEVDVGLEERFEVLLPDFCEGLRLVTIYGT